LSERASTVQTYGRVAAVLFVLTIVGGGFGEMYVPMRLIVNGDAAATAKNLAGSEALFRIGFAAYLLEAIADVLLGWLFYVLLRPAGKDLALLSAFFGIISTTLYAVAELFFFVAPVFLRNAPYLRTFSPDQRNVLAYLSLRVFGIGSGAFMLFYGIAWVIRAWLMFRSGYFPRLLAILLGIGGSGFILRNLAVVLKPAYATDVVLVPLAVGIVCLTIWLLVKGIDVEKWEAMCVTR
jgi:hypothetical protein